MKRIKILFGMLICLILVFTPLSVFAQNRDYCKIHEVTADEGTEVVIKQDEEILTSVVESHGSWIQLGIASIDLSKGNIMVLQEKEYTLESHGNGNKNGEGQNEFWATPVVIEPELETEIETETDTEIVEETEPESESEIEDETEIEETETDVVIIEPEPIPEETETIEESKEYFEETESVVETEELHTPQTGDDSAGVLMTLFLLISSLVAIIAIILVLKFK